jgi:pimeloyl-ACP methyl ester carboxylesterase
MLAARLPRLVRFVHTRKGRAPAARHGPSPEEITMKASRLALGGAAVAAAWWVRGRGGAEPLVNPIGGREIGFQWRGWRIAGTVRGEGPPVLLVHSIHAAASSWEWRYTVDALAANHRVYTYDLLGFGLSERPDAEYSAELYMELMLDFARHVVAGPCALVANSLSGAHAIAAAADAPETFPTLVMIQPTGMTLLTHGNPVASAARQLIRTPGVGTAMFDALTTRPSIRYFLHKSYADDDLVTDAVLRYHQRAARQPGGRFAPAAFLGFGLNCDVREAVGRIRQPTLLVWGSHAETNPLREREEFVRARPDWETLIVDGSGDLPHDEQPDRFNAVALSFLDRTWSAGPPSRESGAGRPHAHPA